MEARVNKLKAKTDWTMHAEALSYTLVVPLNVSKLDFLILPGSDGNGNAGTKKSCFNKSRASAPSPSTGRSPYPMLDAFVANHLATSGGTQGSIRAWSIRYDDGGANTSTAAQKPL
jgi:hypothetical protein